MRLSDVFKLKVIEYGDFPNLMEYVQVFETLEKAEEAYYYTLGRFSAYKSKLWSLELWEEKEGVKKGIRRLDSRTSRD